jgi:hypothetical protein
VELKKACVHVERIVVDHATEAERLLWVASIQIELGFLPIQDITQLPKTVQVVLPAVTLILKCLQEALDSGTDPWD